MTWLLLAGYIGLTGWYFYLVGYNRGVSDVFEAMGGEDAEFIS
jgi:hypothetical protein